MFDNLNASIVEATDADIDDVFGDEAADKGGKGKKTEKTAGKKTEPVATGKTKKTSASQEKTVLGTPKADTMTDFSDDDADAFSSDDDEDDEEEVVKDKKKSKKSPIDVEEEDEESDDEDAEDDDDEEEKDKDKEDEDEDEESDDEETSEETKAFLKARANLLIEKGKWADFEGSANFEWTEDAFAEMEVQQTDYARQQMREDLLESFGPYGKEIADYAAKGGDPDKLIDLFKEQQIITNLSVESEDDQRAVVLKYETEFLNKKPERVKKYIDSLVADKELEAYAKEAKEAMEESLDAERESMKAEQVEKARLSAERQTNTIKKFQSDVSSLVDKATDIPADEKKQLLQVLTKFDKKLKNGTPVNEFYSKFEQFRKDLPNYIKLVRFVMNPDKFIKTIENSGKNKANEKAFRLAVGANKSKKVKSAGGDTSASGKAAKTTFKLY